MKNEEQRKCHLLLRRFKLGNKETAKTLNVPLGSFDNWIFNFSNNSKPFVRLGALIFDKLHEEKVEVANRIDNWNATDFKISNWKTKQIEKCKQ